MLKFDKKIQFLRPQKIEVDLWRPFRISVKPLKSHLHISILWGM